MKARTAVVLSVGLSLAATGAALLYDRRLRPSFRRWGATEVELATSMPGDEKVADPQWAVTYGISIDAAPADVWPWLVQLGLGRAGFYSYDIVERRLGLDIHSVELIVPELQGLKVGDAIPFGAFELPVVGLEPDRLLLLEAEDDETGVASFCFEIHEQPEGGTRLLFRGRARFTEWDVESSTKSVAGLKQLPMVLGFEPGSFVMFRRMLLGIRERAERTRAEGVHAMTAPEGWWSERVEAMDKAAEARETALREAEAKIDVALAEAEGRRKVVLEKSKERLETAVGAIEHTRETLKGAAETTAAANTTAVATGDPTPEAPQPVDPTPDPEPASA
jgi:hypothetical protein